MLNRWLTVLLVIVVMVVFDLQLLGFFQRGQGALNLSDAIYTRDQRSGLLIGFILFGTSTMIGAAVLDQFGNGIRRWIRESEFVWGVGQTIRWIFRRGGDSSGEA